MASEYERFRDAVLKGVRESLETETKSRKLEVRNVFIPRPRDPNDLSRLKAARINQGSFVDKIYAYVRIIDKNSNKSLKEGRVHVADIPVKTKLGTYLIDGTHYQAAKQAQLKGTAFTRIKDNGDVASDFRLERGWNFELNLDPETEKFTLRLKNAGKYPLMPILKTLGAPEEKIREAWKPSMIAQNQTDKDTDRKVIKKFAMRVFGKRRIKGKSFEELEDMIRRHFEVESHINPDASKLTLGKPYKNINADVLLASTKKIIGVHSQDIDPDYRDEIYYKRFRGLPETGYEWIKENADSIKQKIRRRIRKLDAENVDRYPLRSIVGMDVVNPVIKSLFTRSKLRSAGDTTNLLDILANESKVTIMGEHGISSGVKVLPAARDVHPSAAGFIDPVMTSQGSAGESEHIAIGSKIINGKITMSLRNLKTGLRERLSPEKLFGKVVVFPGEMQNKGGKWKPVGWQKTVKAVKDGKLVTVDPKKADYIIPSAVEMYSEVTNLVPFLDSNSGGRAIMGTGQMTQAVSLKEPEAPLVRAQNFEASPTFALGAVAPVNGKVVSVSKKQIKIEDANRRTYKIPLFDNLPLNREAFIDSKPLVKKGDKVKSGQVLADNNFTQNGVLALGKNLYTAIIPWKGYNYEDGQVVSESAAKKLSSVHMYDLSTKLAPKSELSAGRFAAYRGNRYKISEENEKATDIMTGLIKPGTKVKKGDILARIVTKATPDPEDNILRVLRKSIVKPYKVTPIVWERENPGIVTEAEIKGKKINLFVKAVEPAQVGDKLSNRAGHKGVITKIIPDEEVPRIKETGEPIDVMIDPASIPSRVNVGQLLEMGAAKIAKKTGKPYITKLHMKEDSSKVIKKQMDSLGIKSKETLIDPVTKKEIPNINVAPVHTMKLMHQVEHKLVSRNPSDAYDIDRQPIKGRTIDRLTFWAMVGHGAKKNLAEMATLKADQNPEFWAQFESGIPTVIPPEPTYAWKKFEAQLKSMGINPKREGNKMVLMPLTDKEVLSMSNGELTGVDHVRKKNFKPLPGGIFDPELTGGMGIDAKHWTHIKLPEPVLNPMFSVAASKVLGLPAKRLERISRGQEAIQGLTGGPSIQKLLQQVNVDRELEKAKRQAEIIARDTSKSKVNKMNETNKRIRFLSGLKKFKMQPAEAYMMNYVPVMPPAFRHPIMLPDGKMTVPAANFLYKDVAHLALKSWKDAVTEGTKNEVRAGLFDSIAALVGTGEPISNADNPGFLKQITGKETRAERRRGITRQAKQGFFQHKVMRKRQEVSAGAVISAEPRLDVDEIMIPEEVAWNIYGPMVVRKLSQQGMNKPEAKKHWSERTDIARAALQKELGQRPVFINRAPSWHKFNIMAAWPKLHPGNDLKVPNLPINTFYGGDFDGDALSIHVPITQDAVTEAKGMFPSKMFMSSGAGTVMLKPQGSALAGLYDLTKGPEQINKTAEEWLEKTAAKHEKTIYDQEYRVGNKVFKGAQSLKDAYDQGIIKPYDIVTLENGSTNTVGRQIVSNLLPPKWSIATQLNSKKINTILTEVAKEKPAMLAGVANELSRLGDQHATYMGLSLGVDDMIIDRGKSEDIVRDLSKKIDYLDQQWKWKSGGRGRMEREAAKRKEFDSHLNKLDQAVVESIPKNNPFRILWDSGAKGNPTQLRQIMGPPTLFHSAARGEILIPVEKPFAAGLTPAEYYIQQTGGRFGLIQRSVSTSEPGDIGKDLFGVTAGQNITEEDCGTRDGIHRGIDNRDVIDRYLARDISIAKRNDLVTEELVTTLKRRGFKKIMVRSPLTCKAKTGVCSYCYGLDVNGNRPAVGTPVGIDDAQGVIDVIANIALKSWHLSGGKEVGELPFYRYRRLTDLPKHLPNKAVLAQLGGRVTKIEQNALGGIDVYIEGIRHRLPAALGKSPEVKVNRIVKRGDQLTLRGTKKPQDILALEGIRAVQDHITDEMVDIFKSEQPGNIRRKSLENLVASMTKLARVVDPGDSNYLPFDIGPANDIEYYNNHRRQTVKLKDAIGFPLGRNYGLDLTQGTKVDRMVVKALRRRGKREVEINKRAIKFEPILKPLQTIPTFKNDWLSRLNQKYLKDTLMTEPGFGGEAAIHGPDPVPAFAYGAEFGKTNKPEWY